MKIISWNVNGLRSVSKKGFLDWVAQEQPDILCLQEIKAQENQITKDLLPHGYHHFLNCAEKAGYSGVAVFSKNSPRKIRTKLGDKRFDSEGRVLELNFPRFRLVNLYLPHGGRDKSNLGYKLASYKKLLGELDSEWSKKTVLIGDFNIAHQEIDLARPRQNRKNIMFTAEERGQLDALIELGFIDTFRQFHKEGGNYTWWPYFARARQRNLGWWIDYSFISTDLRSQLKEAFILADVTGSDHCPVGIELKI